MGIFDNCIFACDVDATLMDEGYINPRNIEKIDFFVKEGGCFAITSGRGLVAARPIVSRLNSVSKCVLANGSMVYDFEESKVLHEDIIPICDYSAIEYILNSDKDVGVEFYSGDSVFTLQSTNELVVHQTYEKFCADVISFEDAKKLKISKFILMFRDEAHREEIKEKLKSINTESRFVDTGVVVDNVFYAYYEMLPPGVDKFSGINNLKRILGFDNGLIFAMGDYYNDIEMLAGADIAAVPAGTPDDVSKYADFVAGACKDGAVADFIDYLTNKFSKD